ncbi:MAG: Lrp/AsnC family transcriptional regulator [Candidatus Thermoplasmatota archaeon]|nr:Lrp/AsnC family transcriptional regulator [Candidatus Thermoplasmatota archaeon]MBU1941880.1 Lrp/AsnC family transcriptional regulator [Candidatus Thermoplasmatota archaeon]
MKIDSINKKILYLLQNDARLSYKDIAQQLNRSDSTIRDRIKALERTGIIQRYVAIIDKTSLGFNYFAMICANPNSTTNLDEITEKIKQVDNVLRVYQTSGEHRLAIFCVASSYDALKKVIEKHLLPLGLEDEKIVIVLKADHEFLSPLVIP